MPNSFSEYLSTHYNPASNAIGMWLNDQEAARAAYAAQVDEYLRRQAAARAAQERATLAGPNAFLVPPVLSSGETTKAPEDPGFFQQLIQRGGRNLGASIADFAGLIDDLYGYKESAAQKHAFAEGLREAAQQAAPRQVPSLSDVTDASSLGTWAKETLADVLPSTAAALATGGVGGIAAKAAGRAGASLLGRELSKQAARRFAVGGATAGSFAGGSALEAGEAYGTDIESHGIEGTSPSQDLLAGAAAGTLELFGPAGSLARDLAGAGARDIVKKGIFGGYGKAALRGAGIGALKEGSTESAQEVIHLLNEAQQDSGSWSQAFGSLTDPESLARMGESFAAGALLGGPMGSLSGSVRQRNARAQAALDEATANQQEANALLDEAAKIDTTPIEPTITTPRTATERAALDLNQTRNLYASASEDLQMGRQQAISNIDAQIVETQNILSEANNPSSQLFAGATPEAKSSAAKQAQRKLNRLIAQKTKMNELYDAKEKELGKFLANDEKKITQRAIRESVNSSAPMDVGALYRDTKALLEMKDKAVAFSADLHNRFIDSARAVDSKIADISKKLRNVRVDQSPTIRKMYEEQLKALKQERKTLVNSLRNAQKLSDKIVTNADKLGSAKYTPQQASIDLNEMYNYGANFDNAGAVTSEIAAKYLQNSFDKYKKQLRTEEVKARTEARRAKYADRGEVFSETYPTPQAEPLPIETQEVQMSRSPKQVTPSVNERMSATEPFALPDMSTTPRRASAWPSRSNAPAMPLPEGTSRMALETSAMQEARVEAKQKSDSNVTTVQQSLQASFKQIPALENVTQVVATAPDGRFANSLGYTDGNGNIYLIANNIVNEAKRAKRAVKDIACKTLVHEGVAHYGLRVLFNEQQFNKFMSLVDSSFRGSKLWDSIGSSIEGFDSLDASVQAEEFVARFAERKKLANLTAQGKSAWEKVKSFMRTVLRRVGITKVTEQDITDVLSAAVYKLSNTTEPTLRTPMREEGLASTRSQNLDMERENLTRTERAEAEAAQRFPFFNRIKEAIENRNDTLELLRETIVDSYRPVERMIQELKSLGKKSDGSSRVTWDTNVYKLNQHLSNQQSISMQRYSASLVEPLKDLIIATGKPGEDASITFARCDDYVEAVAGLERNEYGMKRGLDKPLVVAKKGQTLEEANNHFREVIAKYQSDAMDAVMTQLQKINNERLKLLEEYKIVPKEVIDAWRSAYKVYMPFKSWENIVEQADPAWYKSSTRKSLSTPGAQRKIMARATGRDGEAQSPITHAILQLYDVAALVPTVQVGRSLLNLARNNPDAKSIFEIVEYREKGDDSWGKPRTYKDPETGDLITEVRHGAMKTVVNKKTGDISLTPTKHTAEGHINETVAVINENGDVERVWLKDPNVARALRGENIARASGVIRTIGNIQHTLGKYMTSRNPLFWITNPIRDTISAAINVSSLSQELKALGVENPSEISKAILTQGLGKAALSNSVRNAIMLYRKHGSIEAINNAENISEEMKQYMSDYDMYLNYGGQTEYFGTNTYETLSKDLIKTLRDKNPVTNAQKAKASVDKMMQVFDEVSGSLENMTRYIAFKEIVNALKPFADRGTTADGRPFSYNEMYSRAANVALNLTVNFSRKGAWAPIFNSLYMFASASIGGNVRMLETIFRKDRNTGKTDWGHVAKFALYPLAGYMLQALLARAIMGEDDDGVNYYDKIPDYIKSSNIIIPNPFGDGSYLTIPMPYGFDIFWNTARQVVDSGIALVTGGPGPNPAEAAASVVSKMFNNFATIGSTDEGWTAFVPSVVRPLVQLSTNKNFAGNPIMPTGNENLRGNIPDHQKYWSSANETVIELCKWMSPVLDVSPESIEHLANAYLGGLGRITFSMLGALDDLRRGKDLDIGKLPGAKIFYKEVTEGDTSALFSKYRTEALTQINAIESAKHDMGLSFADRYNIVNDNKVGYRLKRDLNQIQQKLNEIREHERKVLGNSSFSSAHKAKVLESLKKQKQRYMKIFIKKANQAGL